jgi:hypothetical protein
MLSWLALLAQSTPPRTPEILTLRHEVAVLPRHTSNLHAGSISKPRRSGCESLKISSAGTFPLRSPLPRTGSTKQGVWPSRCVSLYRMPKSHSEAWPRALQRSKRITVVPAEYPVDRELDSMQPCFRAARRPWVTDFVTGKELIEYSTLLERHGEFRR